MSKSYIFLCPKHGIITIEVERPPILHQKRAYCPWCASRMSEAQRVEEAKKALKLEVAPT